MIMKNRLYSDWEMGSQGPSRRRKLCKAELISTTISRIPVKRSLQMSLTILLEGLEDWSVEGHQALQAKCLEGHAKHRQGPPVVPRMLFAVKLVSCDQTLKTQTQVPLSGQQYTLQPSLELLTANVPDMAAHFVNDQSSDGLSNNLPFVQI